MDGFIISPDLIGSDRQAQHSLSSGQTQTGADNLDSPMPSLQGGRVTESPGTFFRARSDGSRGTTTSSPGLRMAALSEDTEEETASVEVTAQDVINSLPPTQDDAPFLLAAVAEDSSFQEAHENSLANIAAMDASKLADQVIGSGDGNKKLIDVVGNGTDGGQTTDEIAGVYPRTVQEQSAGSRLASVGNTVSLTRPRQPSPLSRSDNVTVVDSFVAAEALLEKEERVRSILIACAMYLWRAIMTRSECVLTLPSRVTHTFTGHRCTF